MNKRILLICYRRVFAYYTKCKNRLERRLANGTFFKLAGKKRQSLIKRITKLQAKKDILQRQLGLLTAGTVIALTTTTVNDSFGQSIQLQDVEDPVNTYTTGNQSSPAIAIDSEGDIIISWVSYGQDGDEYNESNIYAQRYNKEGKKQGGEFKVNTYTTGYQSSPAVAMDSDGDFVITWQSYGQDGSRYGVYAQRYNKEGIAQGSEFKANTYTTGDQSSPAIAMDSIGGFVITWQNNLQDEDGYEIYTKRHNKEGIAQGGELKVNTYKTGDQVSPAIAMDSDGDFVITWQSVGQDGDGYGIYAQRYNKEWQKQGTEFKVNSFTEGDQHSPAIAMDSDGDFIITWQSYGQDEEFYENVYGRRYYKEGVEQGGEFKANTYSTGNQYNPAIAMESDGVFVITWQSQDQDGDDYGIYYRLCKVPVDINLHPAAINENGNVGATVGNLTTVDLTDDDIFS